jgi:iron complex outermembrane recepter protein
MAIRAGERQDSMGFRAPFARGLLAAVLLAFPWRAGAQTLEQLRGLSIEQLADIQVTSVAKRPESLSDAPAAIYVITHDQIMRSGYQTIPEILRLAPNLEVAQISATSYAISARGFNVGDNASLSNKLLVLIDGRSVYSPMFGGVYWDSLDVLPEDIERIEVISGPGATLWGANAVNGVINIITYPSSQTQGGLLTVGEGSLERNASVQYGGRLGPDLTYRVNADISDFSAYPQSSGRSADDAWWQPGGGFRLDWTPPNDTLSLQGNLSTETEDPAGFNRDGDLLASWQHKFDNGATLQILTYYDQSGRYENNGSAFTLNTYDLETQYNVTVAGWNNIVVGAGERSFRYEFENTALALVPPSQTLNLANIFAQDTISLSRQVKVTPGVKLEDEPYAGIQAMPSIRIAWKPIESTLLWAAISRAVRSPTPVDANLREFAGPIDYLNGSTGFRPETLTAYEIGTRVQVSPQATFSVSGYHDVYDQLRSIDLSPTPDGLPLVFGNLMAGTVNGVEVWGDYQMTKWWRLSAGFDLMHENLEFLPGSLSVAGLAFVADDPGHQATLHSAMDLGLGVTWDFYLRNVGSLPHPEVPGYTELDMRIGWAVTKRLEVSLAGFNLLHPQHLEFLEPGESVEIPRSVFMEAQVRF